MAKRLFMGVAITTQEQYLLQSSTELNPLCLLPHEGKTYLGIFLEGALLPIPYLETQANLIIQKLASLIPDKVCEKESFILFPHLLIG